MRKLLLLFFTITLISGCSSQTNQKTNYKAKIGSPIEEFIEIYGKNTSESINVFPYTNGEGITIIKEENEEVKEILLNLKKNNDINNLKDAFDYSKRFLPKDYKSNQDEISGETIIFTNGESEIGINISDKLETAVILKYD
ncbi:hypothetical protein J22TS1_43390 [Siminovitchia terrae]|uniref:hypothetical protein n=1 Tax=Siminovitchia terrae TaxID=1914933 RepID=UPI001B2AEB42|nr:hypothetical protein [Siminovitchia terrae]GIN93288.1 hypothetical protein J22TS1_43390 [Siminovitchia terrae]